MVGLETSQPFCIANHLTSFFLIRVLPKNCFWTEPSKCVDVPKSVSGIDLFRYECKLALFFSPLKSCPKRHVQNTPFSFAVAPKLILNDSSVLKFFVFFLDILKLYSQSNYVSDCLFFIENWTERALFKIAAFLLVTSGTISNCFLNPNFLSQIMTYTHKTLIPLFYYLHFHYFIFTLYIEN